VFYRKQILPKTSWMRGGGGARSISTPAVSWNAPVEETVKKLFICLSGREYVLDYFSFVILIQFGNADGTLFYDKSYCCNCAV
jgi:hypothetical protein